MKIAAVNFVCDFISLNVELKDEFKANQSFSKSSFSIFFFFQLCLKSQFSSVCHVFYPSTSLCL